MKIFLAWLVSIISLSANAVTQHELNQLGRTLDVEYQVIDNLEQAGCAAAGIDGHCFHAQLILTTTSEPIPAETMLYFSQMIPIVEASNPNIEFKHLNGDNHRIRFIRDIPAQTTLKIDFRTPAWHASRSDIMPNYYLVAAALEPVVIDSTVQQVEPGSGLLVNSHSGSWSTPSQYQRNKNDLLPLEDSEALYNEMPETWPSAPTTRVLPQVKQRQDEFGQRIIAGIDITANNTNLQAWQPLIEQFGLAVGKQYEPVQINIVPAQLTNPEQYELRVKSDSITINAGSETAAGYGLLTLAQLVNPQTQQAPLTVIADAPRFSFRGVHFDIARSFTGQQTIFMLLEQMAVLKLNKLHLHVSDDEGWRLEIPGLPELTEVGAYRCHDETERRCLMPQLGSGPHRDSQVNGYLTVAQYQSLLRRANELGIEVIPSFDMPGHARAAIKAMEARYHRLMAAGKSEQARLYLLTEFDDASQYSSIQHYNDNTLNPCLSSTYRFIDKLLAELVNIHKDAGVPLKTYHLGADETAGAWQQSPACQQSGVANQDIAKTFIKEVIEAGNSRGLVMAGWSDGMGEALPLVSNADVYVNVWETLAAGARETVEHMAANQTPVVLSLPDVLYFDFPYRNHPLEPGYYWGNKSVPMSKVFEFMPRHLGHMSTLWTDRMGKPYNDDNTAPATDVYGMQVQLWTEVTRTSDSVEYMLFPRLLAFAERAWHAATWEGNTAAPAAKQALNEDYVAFAEVVAKRHYPRLVKAGINVRVPPPGTHVTQQGDLHLRSGLPNLKLEYSLDGISWQTFNQPIPVQQARYARARLVNSHQTSRIIRINQ
ncbi:MAG: carbohydate-binding domain-containing protein [Alteromonadaceae bacterium]|nr:carbohydate-binding domain-containing protein [Alteromonadaceae bacterium]